MKHFYKLLFLLFTSVAVQAVPSNIVGVSDVEQSLDSLNVNIDNLDKMVRNNLFTSGSAPVMFTGEARIKLTDTYWGDTNQTRAGFMDLDRHRLSFWEGNESAVRIAMLARPTGNVILWSKLGFNTTFAGHYLNKYGTSPAYIGSDISSTMPGDVSGYDRSQYLHDKDNNPIFIHEDMNAGIAIRYEPASFWVRMGHTIWTQASPLTIWKAQPRNFAWDYLPFEIEQPIGRYYDYNVAKGVKEGRAAWNKKPFQGIQLESIKLPGDLYANFVYAKFENYDNYEPEYVDYATDRGFAYSPRAGFVSNEEIEKGKGISDTYRWMTHARLFKPFGNFGVGFNYVGIRYSEDYAKLGLQFNDPYTKNQPPLFWTNSPGQLPTQDKFYAEGNAGFNFYKDLDVFSVDSKGSLTNNISYKLDIAVSQVDSQYFHYRDEKAVLGERRTSGYNPAIFTEINYDNSIVPVKMSAVYIDKKFYSPFSFVAPHEAMTPYGSNLLGAGKFIARGEASPYTPNMMGANFLLNPKVPDGHLKINIGLHTQPKKGFNAIYFPYILNGIVLSGAVANSSTRWGNGTLDGSSEEGKTSGNGIGFNPYYQRLGLGNQITMDKGLGDKGGLYADYLSAYEGFIAFTDIESAREANLSTGAGSEKYSLIGVENVDSVHQIADAEMAKLIDDDKSVIKFTSDRFIRLEYMTNINSIEGVQSKKFTHNYSIDYTFNIDRLLGFDKKFYLNSYAGYYELGLNATPTFNFENSKVMLGGNIMRFEPAFQLTKQFYILGMFGIENWFSNKSYMASATKNGETVVLPGTEYFDHIDIDKGSEDVKQVNTDYTDMAFGIGFDWDFIKRVGFHFRASHNLHKDNAIIDEKVIDVDGNVRTGVDVNGYEGNVISGELKMFF